MQTPRVISVNVGQVKEVDWSEDGGPTAIDKRPVDGPVRVGSLGVAGDEHGDVRHHGGVDQAVYAYAREDLDHWQGELGRELRAGQFGENLTTAGLDVTGLVIGERLRIGEAVLEVSSARIPCLTFQGWLGEEKWVRRFTAYAHPGAYLRVLTEGELAAGDEVVVEHRPEHGVTVGEAFLAIHGERSLVPRLLDAPELSAKWQDKARRLLGAGRTA